MSDRQAALLRYVTGEAPEPGLSVWHDKGTGELFQGPTRDWGAAERVAIVEGGVGQPGEELIVDEDLFIDQVTYSEVPFHPITAVTFVYMDNSADYAAFLEDADLARTSGIFPERLLEFPVVLADSRAITGQYWDAHSKDARFTVHGGTVYRGRNGAVAGSTASPISWAPSSTQDIDDSAGSEIYKWASKACEERPWLPRFGVALGVLRGLRAAGQAFKDVQISGFGWQLLPGDGMPGRATMSTNSLHVARDGESFYVIEAGTRRRFRVSKDVAVIVEAICSPLSETEKIRAVATSTSSSEGVAQRGIQDTTTDLFRRGVLARPDLTPDVKS